MATRVMATATVKTWVMVMVTRLAGDEEGKGEGGKGDGNGDDGGGRQRGNGDGCKSNGDGNNGGGRAMAMATKRVMVMVTTQKGGRGWWARVVGDETGIGNGGKSDGYGDKVGGQQMASRAMVRATVMRWRGPP